MFDAGLSAEGAASGGVVSAVLLYLARMAVSRTLGDIAESIRTSNTRHEQVMRELAEMKAEIAYIRGSMPKRHDDTWPPK